MRILSRCLTGFGDLPLLLETGTKQPYGTSVLYKFLSCTEFRAAAADKRYRYYYAFLGISPTLWPCDHRTPLLLIAFAVSTSPAAMLIRLLM